jgi:hypothetical protein
VTSTPDSNRFDTLSPSGPSAYRRARSGVRRVAPLHRREDLVSAHIGHWRVIDSAPRGYWVARCGACNMTQEVRLDASSLYIPRCRGCGCSSPDTDIREERERHFRTGAWRAGMYGGR